MDQTVMNATTEFLHTQISALQEAIEKKDAYIKQLESAHANAVTRSTTEAAERNIIKNEMQEWTLEAIENGTIDESAAQEIADICGFELSKEFELEVTVQYSITVNARDEESAQNLIHDIDFDSVSYGEEVTYLSSSVDRIEI
jgi:hypothetical protein